MIEIVEANFGHAEYLADHLRDGDAMEIKALGFTPIECLDAVLCRSVQSETVLADGKVAAMRGYSTDSLLGDTADVWTFTSTHSNGRRVTFLKESMAYVERLHQSFKRLRAFVAVDYAQSVRWLRWLGFRDGEIETHGGRAFMRVTRYGR